MRARVYPAWMFARPATGALRRRPEVATPQRSSDVAGLPGFSCISVAGLVVGNRKELRTVHALCESVEVTPKRAEPAACKEVPRQA